MSPTRLTPVTRPTSRTVERALAVALLALLGAYAVGVVVEGRLATVHAVGVAAVHLAVLVGGALPVVVLGHASVGRLRRRHDGTDGERTSSAGRSTLPGRVETAVAGVSLLALVGGLTVAELAGGALARPVLAVAVAATLALAGRLARARPSRHRKHM